MVDQHEVERLREQRRQLLQDAIKGNLQARAELTAVVKQLAQLEMEEELQS